MARLVNRLSDASAKSLVTPGMHADGGGLYLAISAARTKSWIYRFSLKGRVRDMGLGRLADVSLAQARRAAGEARALRNRGIDPIEDRKAALAASPGAQDTGPTSPKFEDFAEEFIAAREGTWKNEAHRRHWRQALEDYAFPVIGQVGVADVSTDDMLEILEPIWLKIPETANRVRSRIERILAAAAVKGLRSAANVAIWRGHLSEALPKRPPAKHFAAMPFEEVPAFLAELRAIDTVTAAALEFVILNAARTKEVLDATWAEISTDRSLWIIPGERMKSKRPHTVPLTDAGRAVLEKVEPLRGEGDYIFPGMRRGCPLSENSLLQLLQKRLKRNCTTHGFRSSFRDWAGDMSNAPREVAEAALAHAVGDETERAYRRSDALQKRSALMAEWARYCAGAEIIELKGIPAA